MSERDDLPGDLPEEQTDSLVPRTAATAPRPGSEAGLASWTLSAPKAAEAETLGAPSEFPAGPQTPAPGSAAYELRRMVGRGGMGEVWEALQTSLGRTVALKRVQERRDGEDGTRQIEFQLEAVISAQLEHPNIVPVYDLGRDAAGAPLLAMKLVDGDPWDKMLRADFAALSDEDILARHLPILANVAQATAFAHSRGIVHRDLKPSQVMVGAFGEVLLMDWGLAVTMGGGPANVATPVPAPSPDSASNPAGTPALMAPEQTRATAEGIGPWTDVYLLGGILYILLTKSYPHQAGSSQEAFQKARAGAVEPVEVRAGHAVPAELRELCEQALSAQVAARPAGAQEFLDRLKDYLSGASRRRESQALAARAAEAWGEFGRAAAKAAQERYRGFNNVSVLIDQALQLWPENAAAKGLRLDVLTARIREEIAQGDLLWARLHLESLRAAAPAESPIVGELARELDGAEAARTRQRRLVRMLGAAAAVLLAATGLFAWRTTLAQAEAQRSQQFGREQERLHGLYARASDLQRAEAALAARMERELPLPELADVRREETLRQTFAIDGATAAALLRERGELAQERAALVAELPSGATLGEEPYQLLLGEANLAFHTAGGAAPLERALGLYLAAASARAERPEPLLGAGLTAWRAGQVAAAVNHFDEASSLTLRLLGDQHPAYEKATTYSAAAHRELDESSTEAFRLFRDSAQRLAPQWAELTLALAERALMTNDLHAATAWTSATLELAPNTTPRDVRTRLEARATGAKALEQLARYREASASLEQALATAKEQFGERSLEVAKLLSRLGELKHEEKEILQAIEFHKQALSIREELAGADSTVVAESLSNVAAELTHLAKFDEAEALLNRALAIDEAARGPHHPEVAARLQNLALVAMQTGRLAEAEQLILRVKDIQTAAYGEGSPLALSAMNGLAVILYNQGKVAESVPIFEDVLRVQEQVRGPAHPETIGTLNNYSAILFALGRREEAVAASQRGLSAMEREHGADSPLVLQPLNRLAYQTRMTGKRQEAQELWERSLAITERSTGPNSESTLDIVNRLANNAYAMQKHGVAAGYLERAVRLTEAVHPGDATKLADALAEYGKALAAADRHEESLAVSRRLVELHTQLYGPDSHRAAAWMTNVGNDLLALGRAEEALGHFEQALTILEPKTGDERKAIGRVFKHLANTHLELEQYSEALDAARRAVAACEAEYGADAEDTALALLTLGKALVAEGQEAEGMAALGRALPVLEAGDLAEYDFIKSARMRLDEWKEEQEQ